jgi:hypothetical protein
MWEVGVECNLCPLVQCSLYCASVKETCITSVTLMDICTAYSADRKRIVENAGKIWSESRSKLWLLLYRYSGKNCCSDVTWTYHMWSFTQFGWEECGVLREISVRPWWSEMWMSWSHFLRNLYRLQNILWKTTVLNFMKIRHAVCLLITGHGRTDGRRNVVSRCFTCKECPKWIIR